MVAISSLLVAFFILEIMLAATLVRSTTLASLQPSSEHEVSITRSFLGPQTILNYFENHCEKLLSKKKNPKRFKAGAASVEIKQTLSSDWLTYPGKKKNCTSGYFKEAVRKTNLVMSYMSLLVFFFSHLQT